MRQSQPGRERFCDCQNSSMVAEKNSLTGDSGFSAPLKGLAGYNQGNTEKRDSMSFTKALITILLATVLFACAALRPAPPEIQLTGLEITDLSLTHANFLARLQLYNPNGVSLDIKGLKFTLFLNDVRVADGQTAKSLTIPAEQRGEASIRLSSSLFNLYQLTRKLQGQDQIAFRINGEVTIGGLGILRTTIPIEREGVLPLAGTLNQLRSVTR